MAKIAMCGYGSQGQGVGNNPDGYAYVVDDSVKTGQKIQVVSTSRAGRKFATTAVPLHTYKRTSVKGFEARQKAEEKASDGKITWSYTGKELGVKGSKETQDKLTGEQKQSDYTMKTRAGNIAKYLEQNPNAQLSKNASETFASYSSKFMPKGDTL